MGNTISDLTPKPLPANTVATSYNHNGNYVVQATLGIGTYGIVYRVAHQRSTRLFAMKVMQTSTSAQLRRFREEATILATLSHPNIAVLEDIGGVSDSMTGSWNACLLTELANYNLLEFYSAYSSLGISGLDEALAQTVAHQLLSALAYLHDQDFVHRDIKPANILVFWTPRSSLIYKLSDFGLAAHFLEDESVPPPVARYTAPELLLQGHDPQQMIWLELYSLAVCFVHPPLLVSLEGFQDLFEYTVLPTTIFKAVIYDILVTIDFLHTEAHMVHTDIQAGNIVLGSKDSSIFGKLLEAESNNPSARKTIDNYTLYQSQALTLDEIIDNIGPLFLTDFGEARTQADGWHGLIQPDPFRSPEIILKMPWTTKTDIWNPGVMARIFCEARNRALYWDDKGRWVRKADIPDDSLEKSHERLLDKDFEQFAAFFRETLQWDPENRQSAAELLKDEWLLGVSD
ncbi:kinase-like protein, partial [Aureobasidium melanogenum]